VVQNSRSLGHTDECGSLHAQMSAQRLDIRGIVNQGGRSRGQSVSTPVESDQPEGPRERADLRLPHVQIESPAVDQQDRRTRTLIAVSQPGVGHFQETIDWAQVKATGIQCVMIKATQGLSKDSHWEINRDRARQQGLLVIPYAFVTSVDPAEQAKFFVQTAGLAAGMPAALDWEGDNAPGVDVVERRARVGQRPVDGLAHQAVHRDVLALGDVLGLPGPEDGGQVLLSCACH